MSESPVTLILILLNVLVSGYALLGDRTVVDRFSFRPAQILGGRQYYRLISAGFLHVGFGHLLFNMITLFFFGPTMELFLGSIPFLGLYFGSELAAHGLSLVLHRDTPNYAAIGASGAISGVLFGFCLFRPFDRIYVMLIPIGIPAIIFAVAYVALSMYAMQHGRAQGMTGGIAHEAHIGGAAGGVLITILLEPAVVPHFLQQIGLG